MPHIIDHDSGPDDIGLLFGELRAGDVHGVIASFGCATGLLSHRNTEAFLNLAGAYVPLIKGLDGPMHPHPESTVPTYFGSNGLNDVCIPDSPTRSRVQMELSEAISLFVDSPTACLDYVISGPCSNLAWLIENAESHLRHGIGEVYLMGGAVKSGGNMGLVTEAAPFGVAEYNWWADPRAAESVLQFCNDLGRPATVVTWDEGKTTPLPKSHIERLRGNSDPSDFILRTLRAFFDLYHDDKFDPDGTAAEPAYALCDPLLLLARRGIGSISEMRVRIDSDHTSPTFGASVEDANGIPIRYFHVDDPERALQLVTPLMGFELRS